jgi:hypothetical protein
MDWLLHESTKMAFPLLGTAKQKYETFKGDCDRLQLQLVLRAEKPAIFDKLLAGKKGWEGWRRADEREAAVLAAQAVALGDRSSLVGMVSMAAPPAAQCNAQAA